jgi:hypothetical protein
MIAGKQEKNVNEKLQVTKCEDVIACAAVS